MLNILKQSLLIMTAFATLASANTKQSAQRPATPVSAQEQSVNPSSEREVMRALIGSYKLVDEKKYDGALAAAYSALKGSREIKDDVLEIETLRLLSSIEMKLGNELVGAKFLKEHLTKLTEAMKTLGYVGWYKKATVTYIDLLRVDERYLVYSLDSESPLGEFNHMMEQFREQLEEAEDDVELPPEKRRAMVEFKAKLEPVSDKLTKAVAEKNVKSLKEAYIELGEVVYKGTELAAKFADEEDREEAEAMKQMSKQFKTYLSAYMAMDKTKALAVIEGMYRPMDEMMKRDDGVSLEEALKEGMQEMEVAIEKEEEEVFRQMFRVNSSKTNLNIYLLHFMKADSSIEPTLERYGYLTWSELTPYKERILEEVDALREEQARTGNNEVDIPDILPAPEYTITENMIAASSAYSPESRWLYTNEAALLLTAKDEIGALTQRTTQLERRLRINSEYSRAHLFLRSSVVAYDEGKPLEAISYLQQALSIFQKRADHELIWQTYFMMALVHKKQGDISQAVSCLKESVNTIEGMRSSFRAENLRALVVEDRVAVYEILIDLLIKANDSAAALNYVEKTKARILLDRFVDPRMKAIPRTNPSTVSTVQSALQKLRELEQDRYERTTMESLQAEALNASIENENKRYASALEELRYSNPEYAAMLSGETKNVDAIQKLIDDDTVIVQYYIGADKTHIFVINNKGPVEVRSSNISQLELETKIKSFRNRIETLSDDYPLLARELYSILISPVESRIRGKRLCIIPHGASHFLPFQALMKGDRYLIQDNQIFYAPSSSVLKYAFDKRRVGANRILIIADPAGNLPSAQAEAQDIAALLPNTRLLLGRDATRAKVLDSMAGMDMIHFATHAYLDQEKPLLSKLILADGSSLSVADIYSLELKATLVTLSACQTQMGRLTTGDEIIGLSRAFIFAGVPSLVTSLWEVSDDSTSRLMRAFYQALGRAGTTKAEAIRQAQLNLIGSPAPYSHPRNWAHFVLIGDFK